MKLDYQVKRGLLKKLLLTFGSDLYITRTGNELKEIVDPKNFNLEDATKYESDFNICANEKYRSISLGYYGVSIILFNLFFFFKKLFTIN